MCFCKLQGVEICKEKQKEQHSHKCIGSICSNQCILEWEIISHLHIWLQSQQKQILFAYSHEFEHWPPNDVKFGYNITKQYGSKNQNSYYVEVII